MNDNNELDALLATIEGELWEQCPDCLGSGFASGDSKGEPCPTCDGGEIVENIKGREALATLRTRLATMEAEREALREFKAQIEQSARPHMAMSPERFSRDVHAILKAHKQS